MKLYNRETDKTFTPADIKQAVIKPFRFTAIMYVVLQASLMKENDISVIGLTRSEHERLVMRLYDKYNGEYYTADWRWK